ncbi:hypothetical protein ACFOUV_18550 [Oceanobacillus longus]|uniref:Uncharacterized protein n=1 Tax=Oceanobacillus longus TaxID=930120 RepID=A0ABV8H1K1_9BACI
MYGIVLKKKDFISGKCWRFTVKQCNLQVLPFFLSYELTQSASLTTVIVISQTVLIISDYYYG